MVECIPTKVSDNYKLSRNYERFNKECFKELKIYMHTVI